MGTTIKAAPAKKQAAKSIDTRPRMSMDLLTGRIHVERVTAKKKAAAPAKKAKAAPTKKASKTTSGARLIAKVLEAAKARNATRPKVGTKTMAQLGGNGEAESHPTETQGEQDARKRATLAAAATALAKLPAKSVVGATRGKPLPPIDVSKLPKMKDRKADPGAPWGRALDGTPLTKHQWAKAMGKWQRNGAPSTPRAPKAERPARSSHGRPRTSRVASMLPAVDTSTPIARDEPTVALRTLAIGDTFKTPDDAEIGVRGWYGRLEFVNECRALVTVAQSRSFRAHDANDDETTVSVNGRRHFNISPNAAVVRVAVSA